MARKRIHIEPKAIRALLRQGLTYKQCCDLYGISEDTLNRRRKQEPDLELACQQGKAVGIAKVTNALYTAAINGNITAQIFFLKNQAGWKDKQDLFEGDTNKQYVIIGTQPAEDVPSWVDKHKPALPPTPVQ